MTTTTAATSIKLIKTDKGMSLLGMLTFATVSDGLEQGIELLMQHSNQNNEAVFEIDCKEIKRIDSAGISLLLEWQRQGDVTKTSICFVGLTNQTQSLLKAYNLQTLIAA